MQADSAFHNWYRFVLSFPPHLVRDYIAKFDLGADSTLLDPFCGTGTTLVEAKKLGVGSVGIEGTPIGAFASQVKTDWSVSSADLRRDADQVAQATERAWATEQWRQDPTHIIRETRSLFGNRSLSPEEESLLLKGSISPLPLHRWLTILNYVDATSSRDALRLALAWSLVNGVGNIRFGPEVGITKPKDDADVLGLWHAQALRMADDLEAASDAFQPSTTVFRGDARELPRGIAPESIDAVITSPPYPNEKDYTRTTRLESVLLGLIRSKVELRAIKEGLVRSNTRGVFVSDTDDAKIEEMPEVARIAESIEARRKEMGKTSGFERLYHRVTRLYFGGMRRHLASMKPILKPGARLAYVVGDQASYLQVMIRTGHLLADIARLEGYEVEGIDLFRTRIATATKEQLREEVILLRWKGR